MIKTILGIETSCDDTCVAIVSETYEILCNLKSSPNQEHSKSKGVVRELAARIHNETLSYSIDQSSKTYPLTFILISGF